MNLTAAADFSENLAAIADTLTYVLPLVAGIAGIFGIASLFFFSFVRNH